VRRFARGIDRLFIDQEALSCRKLDNEWFGRRRRRLSFGDGDSVRVG
jgi:hypothetical protein